MSRSLTIAFVVTCGFAVASCAARHSESAAPAAATLPSGTVGESAVTVTATVEKVDLKKRLVTLRGPDGKSVTVKVDERVRNLPQVKAGDEVTAVYYQSIAYEVKPASQGEPGVTTAAQLDRAKLGEMPGAVGARAITVTATITDIDTTNNTVTLLGPDGNSVTVKARDPQKLKQVKKGDLVDITYTEAVAIGVEPKPKE
jgi:translation elongation factor P/translation initiation factor 5A